MTRRHILALAGALAALLVVFLLLRGGGEDGGRPAGFEPPAGFGGPLVVEAVEAVPGPYQLRSEFVGRLRARSEAELYAKTSGQIVEVRADAGDPIREGQLLARIDDAEAREGVEQARASLRMAEATLVQRQAALRMAEAEAVRAAALADREVLPVQELERVEAERDSARAQLELAQAQVEQARANLGSAEVELRNTRIEAPFDGLVGRRFLDRGAFATTNRPVFSVVDLDSVRLSISLVERDAARVEVGQTATIALDAYPGETFEGRIARISPVFDPATNTAEAEIEIDNPDARLRPGMYANVAVEFGGDGEALLVPRQAVHDEGRDRVVYVVDTGEEDAVSRARRVRVRVLGVGAAGRDLQAVEGAIEPGQRVVTLAPEGLRDGAALRLAGAGEQRPRDENPARRNP